MVLQSVPLAAIDFNAELLSGLGLAWGEACDYLQDLPRQSTLAGRLAPEQLYAIIPRAEVMAAEDPEAHIDAWLSTRIAKKVMTAKLRPELQEHLRCDTPVTLLLQGEHHSLS